MSFSLLRKYLLGTILLALAVGLSGCASPSIASFAQAKPAFDPMEYFAGRTRSWGVFETRGGRPKSVLRTATKGRRTPEGLQFEQDLFFDDGRKMHRSWLVRRRDAHHFTATGTGIVGVARGTSAGNVFHLEFTLDAFPGNPLGHLHMSQWMYLQPDGVTMINRATLTKAGVVVTGITEQFRKVR